MARPEIVPFMLGEYQTNCHVVRVPPGRTCWIVDCGFQPEAMLDHVERESLTPAALLLTHTHVDHIAGLDQALARFGPMPVWVHEAEAGFCSDPMKNLSVFSGMEVSVAEPDRHLHDGDVLELSGTRWRVLHTPGHSPGGVCFIHDESAQAIVGDLLFAGSIGRIDFPSSDTGAMRASLERIMTLPDETTIYPGHGPTTTIGAERRTNPFIVSPAAWE